MGEYGEPWTWKGDDASQRDVENGETDRQDVCLADADGKLLLLSCSCCNGLGADKRIMDRIVACVNASAGQVM